MSHTRKRNLLLTAGTLIVTLILGYLFIMHTVRGSSFALYAIGGWHAPLSVKWECAAETDFDVAKKFTLPLLFDEDTKDELKGFWFYSYYRQCLYDNGYDFKGNPVPPSVLAENTYTNSFGGFSFKTREDAILLSDNTLNVDFHDQLLVSTIATNDTTLFVHVFLKDDNFKTFEDLENNLQHISLSKSDIVSSDLIESEYGTKLLRVRDTEGTEGVVFLTPSLHVVHIFGSQQLKTTFDDMVLSVKTF